MKHRFFEWLLISLFLCISPTIYAQQIKVSGLVTDKDKEPLIGVAVFTESKNAAGAITDSKGRYTISVPANATLHFSYIGMETVTVKMKGQRIINVMMEESLSTTLQEVVVSVGYGHVKKRDLTGSVGQANMEELNQAPVTSIEQALAGRIAGLNIILADGSPGAEATVNIRGGGVSQDTAPLYVIDGFPMENFSLNTLDPRSIASIEVLKDASSIAIYGSRGANGVIIINTKEGEAGKPRVTYDYNISFNTRPKFIKMMNAYEYVKLQLELDAIDNRSYSIDRYLGAIDETTGQRPRTLDYYKENPGTDWQKEVTQMGITHNHSISLSGGSKDTKYMIKGGYMDQDAIVKNTGQTRYSVMGKVEQKINKKLTAIMNANYTNTKTLNNQAFSKARNFFPTTGLQSTEEFIAEMEYMLEQGTLSDSGIDYGSLITPLQQANNELNKRIQQNTQAGLTLKWQPFKYITVTPRMQVSTVRTDIDRFYNRYTYQGHLFKKSNGTYANNNGVNAHVENNEAKSYLGELVLNYKRKFKKIHSLDAMYGFTYQHSEFTKESYDVVNILPEFEYLGFYGLSAGSVKGGDVNYEGNKNRLVSSFGRINYNLMDKYLFTVTSRYDGSSKFAKGNQWGFFPSAAFAWRISSEPFLKKSKAIDDAKIRLSYGKVGNNRGVNDFSYLIEFGGLQNARQYMLDGKTLQGGLFQYFLANPQLTWEETTEFNIGTDVTLFKNRLAFSIDYYRKVVDGLLMPRPAPFYLGYGNNAHTRYENSGCTQSQGLELTILSTNIKSGDFTWNTNFNFSYNQNKVRSFANGYEVMTVGNNDFNPNTETWLAIANSATSQFYGYKYVRLYQESDFYKNPNGTYVLKEGIPTYKSTVGGYRVQPGDPMYADLNGDGYITSNDRTTLGSPNPKITGGISNTFTYRNLSLNVFFQYSLGSKIVDYNRLMFETTGSFTRYSNQYASYANRWTPENTNTDIPRLQKPTSKGDAENISQPKLSDRSIEKGDYLRLSTLSLSYRLPKSLLKKIAIQNVVLSVAAQNLFVITGYNGQDPEVNSYNTNAAPKGLGYNVLTNSNTYTSITSGLDKTPYPRARVFNLGISVTF
ncbi:SusC/RagA family TonB-linked outer membrane protein [Bacteroides sp. L008]|uniref:SusC/RagA family TonB-linked outer membrane protein n=1 Tax=Bacteroides sp. L008 TaxID=3162404 RepID=UPI0034657508